MARINVEDDWFKDDCGRRLKLILALGDEYRADGMALAAWRMSQKYWSDGEQHIPDDVWEARGLEPLIAAGLAERGKDGKPGVYVRGTKEQHDWLKQRKEAGKNRAKGDRDESGRFAPKAPARHQRDTSESQRSPATHQPHTHTLSLIDLPTVSPPNSPPARGAPPSVFDQVLAEKWVSWARERQPHLKLKLSDCAQAIRKLREFDGFSEDVLEAVFVFVRKSEFWSLNALSPAGLRTKSQNGLRKIDNIVAAMQRAKPAASKSKIPWATEEDADGF